ncbi:GFA family protein [Primorskyibacter sp. S187A]|uniref:GFA family protein n=1 Tax=Primorskyibacter sp. S187A TaxID=3415130 RepID=UPI003C7CEEAB
MSGTDAQKPITGGCKCGRIRYAGLRSDAAMFRCHCRDCQHLTGAGHADMVPLQRASFEISADCTIYEMRGGSGQPTFSGFCPGCGSQIFRRSTRMPDRMYVHAASLDDPTIYAPDISLYPEAAQPWDRDSIIQKVS